jgi:hypothetical protein
MKAHRIDRAAAAKKATETRYKNHAITSLKNMARLLLEKGVSPESLHELVDLAIVEHTHEE